MGTAGRTVRLALFAFGLALTARYYLWAAQAAPGRFPWGYDLGGYYNYLTRGFLSGRLSVPIDPAPELLAVADPWGPSVKDEHKMHDMAFYNGRYYLYHGVGPVALFFLPWRVAAGSDAPENFAAFVFCSVGLLCSSLLAMRLIRLANVEPGPVVALAVPVVLGLCGSAPYLFSRVKMYEVAIAAGYACVSAGFCFLARGLTSGRACPWLGAAGAMFGCAIACRPHLGLAGVFAMAAAAVRFGSPWRREAVALAAPLVATGLAVAAYNYARFGDPFEFGIRYLLTGPHQNRVRLSVDNLLPGAYYFLACAPELSGVFPWIHMRMCPPPGGAFPPGYVIEATTGALFLAPFFPAGFWLPRGAPGPARTVLAALLASAGAILLFHMATGWTTQRYLADFLPLLVLAALTLLCVRIGRARGWRRAALTGFTVILVAAGAVVNLALAVTGPYDDFLRNRPANYLRLAARFTPAGDFRPVRNPLVEVSFEARFPRLEDGTVEPLVTMGRGAYSYFLWAEHGGGRIRIRSYSEGSMAEAEIPREGPHAFELAFVPSAGEVSLRRNGAPLFNHAVRTLVTAKAQVDVGVNRIEPARAGERFSGALDRVRVRYEAR